MFTVDLRVIIYRIHLIEACNDLQEEGIARPNRTQILTRAKKTVKFRATTPSLIEKTLPKSERLRGNIEAYIDTKFKHESEVYKKQLAKGQLRKPGRKPGSKNRPKRTRKADPGF